MEWSCCNRQLIAGGEVQNAKGISHESSWSYRVEGGFSRYAFGETR